MPSTTIHQGSYQSIDPSSSPGLAFLRRFLTASDSLNQPDHTPLLSHHLHPDATFTINNNPPLPASQILPMLAMRSTKVSRFGHDVHTAWDIAKDEVDGGKGRTLMFQSTSFTVFAEDAEGVEVRVEEFSVIELEERQEGEGGGLRATEVKTYMDPAPVEARARAVMGKTG
jgi:hypothetical protein